jgi:predicted nucleic acid-binding protein
VTYTLDSSAMIAFLRDEPGADVVRLLLRDPDNRCYAHALNLCEVYYDFARRADGATARAAVQDLLTHGVVPREDLDAAFWQRAGNHKALLRRISPADCLCLALAERVNGELVTSDHHEFDPLVPLGLCAIQFIR